MKKCDICKKSYKSADLTETYLSYFVCNDCENNLRSEYGYKTNCLDTMVSNWEEEN